MNRPPQRLRSPPRFAPNAFLILAILVLVGPSFGFAFPGLFFNWSGSAPRGVWRAVAPEIDITHSRGSWVVVCPPLSAAEHRQLFLDDPPTKGACRSQRSLKQIAAVPGDRVRVDHPSVVTPLATVEAVAVDPTGRPLPRPPNGEYVVVEATYWVLNPHARSVDSRYFGPVSTSDIDKRAVPLWTLP